MPQRTCALSQAPPDRRVFFDTLHAWIQGPRFVQLGHADCPAPMLRRGSNRCQLQSLIQGQGQESKNGDGLNGDGVTRKNVLQ